MDEREREYLKRKVDIKNYKMSVFISLSAGPMVLALCLEFFHLFTSFGPLFEFLFSVAYCVVFILLALWAKSKAGGYEIKLERERKKAQLPNFAASIPPSLSERSLQHCPSCGELLPPDWEFCGYCGKSLKKSD